MRGKTHASCGLLIGMYLSTDYGVSIESIGILAAALSGSLIPDICHTKSKIGRKMPVTSWIVRSIFGHRTFTHSFLFVLFFYLLFQFLGIPDTYTLPFTLGIASHILLDFMTHSGVSLFYPFKKRFSFPVSVKTGGWSDYVLLMTFLFMSVAILAYI